jgi:hypothetical protein
MDSADMLCHRSKGRDCIISVSASYSGSFGFSSRQFCISALNSRFLKKVGRLKRTNFLVSPFTPFLVYYILLF